MIIKLHTALTDYKEDARGGGSLDVTKLLKVPASQISLARTEKKGGEKKGKDMREERTGRT